MPSNRLFALLCLVSTFILYFEWGEQQQFLIQMEGEVILQSFQNPKNLLHPLILLPLIGQFLFLFIAIYPNARRILPIIAVSFFGLLVFIVLLAGVSGQNFKIIGLALPYVLISSLWLFRRKNVKV